MLARRDFLLTSLSSLIATTFAPAMARAQAAGVRADDPEVQRMTQQFVEANLRNAGFDRARVSFAGSLDRFRSEAQPTPVRGEASSTSAGETMTKLRNTARSMTEVLDMFEDGIDAFEVIVQGLERLSGLIQRLADLGQRFAKAIVAIANGLTTLVTSLGSVFDAIGRLLGAVGGAVRSAVNAVGEFLRRLFGRKQGGDGVIGIDLDGDGEIDIGDFRPFYTFMSDSLGAVGLGDVNFAQADMSVMLASGANAFGALTETRLRGSYEGRAVEGSGRMAVLIGG